MQNSLEICDGAIISPHLFVQDLDVFSIFGGIFNILDVVFDFVHLIYVMKAYHPFLSEQASSYLEEIFSVWGKHGFSIYSMQKM